MARDLETLAARADAAYRALCALEDELDGFNAKIPSDSHADSVLRTLWHRWNHDTARKINRTVARPDLTRARG